MIGFIATSVRSSLNHTIQRYRWFTHTHIHTGLLLVPQLKRRSYNSLAELPTPQSHCTIAHMKFSISHANSSEADLLYSSVLLVLSRSPSLRLTYSFGFGILLTFIDAWETTHHSKHMSRDRYPSLLCDVTARVAWQRSVRGRRKHYSCTVGCVCVVGVV
jgi:hypothetical protein